jgi:hypothetical protein
MLINALRGHLGEFGIVAPVGRHRVVDLIGTLHAAPEADVPALDFLRKSGEFPNER